MQLQKGLRYENPLVFRAWTKESTKPITLWVEAKNQGAARNLIFRENPFISKLMFYKTTRIE